jgi:hypothetical protein
MALAGCGSAVAGGPGPAATGARDRPPAAVTVPSVVPLCADARKLDQVTARLTAPRAGEVLPRVITLTNASQVRAVATALCGLPSMPRGVRHCPAARAGALRLVFTAGGHAYRPLLIRDTGCASVTGIGPVRQWSWSSRPGRLLSAAEGGYGRLTPSTHPSSVPLG